MSCRICAWLCDWFGAEDRCARLWARFDGWEREHSNDWELWCEDSDENRHLIEQAHALRDSDPETAFRLYLQAADAGSVWAMQVAGRHYHTGTFVAADFGRAQEHYRRAIDAGSWMATITYAELLASHGHFAECDQILEDGIRSDFVPAFFGLARLRYRRSGSRRTCREIRPLLEHAAAHGHPGAKPFLATLQLLGKFGLREIPAGLRTLRDSFEEMAADAATVEETGSNWNEAGGRSLL